MSKVELIKLAKNLKRKITKIQGNEHSPYMSYTRRINKVKTTARVCAMTFDDGPMNLPPCPSDCDKPLTLILLETLEKHNALGTFDVIGTTENNYPDIEGNLGTPSWSGVKFDHYPSFSKDSFAGAVNCPKLIDRILSGGHQITNHTFSHVLYGKKNIIYSKRNTFSSFEDVRCDLLKLDNLLTYDHNYKMQYSRPPHYVDKIEKGLNTYDLYALENYLYLGASFDGAGWLPCKTYEYEVDAMVTPLENELKSNPDSMCGQIIFQKDGYNMVLRTPVATALDKQLEILDYYGYRVITVEELVNMYPFADVDEYDKDFDLFKNLVKEHPICYTDNTLRPDSTMTLGELAVLVAPKSETVDKRITAILNQQRLTDIITNEHPYSGAISWSIDNNIFKNVTKRRINLPVIPSDFENLTEYFDVDLIKKQGVSRRTVLCAMKK